MWGLECPYERSMRYCEHDKECLALLREQQPKVAEHGTNQCTGGGDNVTSSRGNQASYTLARLKRDRPDLAEQVIAGNLSPNAAAVQAGFRHPMLQVRADDLQAAWNPAIGSV